MRRFIQSVEGNIPRAELERRVQQLSAFYIDKDSKMCFETERVDEFCVPFTQFQKEVSCLGEYDKENKVVFVREGTEGKKKTAYFVHECVTLHEDGSDDTFRPSLSEVAVFLPEDLFWTKDVYFVFSQPVKTSEGKNLSVCGIQVAKTLVLVKNKLHYFVVGRWEFQSSWVEPNNKKMSQII